VVAQPTWQIVAPDEPTIVTSPSAQPTDPAAPDQDHLAASGAPQWPLQPEWPSQRPSAGLPGFGRPAAATGGIEALWAESAREVASHQGALAAPKAATGVQPCVSCGLSLSATARFCRRCGSRQG
jgi:ribosomal protein L40E